MHNEKEPDILVHAVDFDKIQDNAPFIKESIVEVLDQEFKGEFKTRGNCQDGITRALKRLSDISPQHKFVLNVTEMKLGTESQGPFEVYGRLGASWDVAKDGAYNHHISQVGRDILITVIWLAK